MNSVIKNRSITVNPSGLWVTLVFMLVIISGCGPAKPTDSASADLQKSLYTFQEGHMGTQFTIRTWAGESKADKNALKTATDAAFTEIHRLEMIFSDYQTDSEVIKLTSHELSAKIPISEDFSDVLEQSIELSRATDGAFDVTVSPMIRLWRMARKNHQLPTDEQLATARERSGFEKLVLDPDSKTLQFSVENMRLDFGGIVKGVSADRALRIMRDAGFSQTIVAASGDIAVGDAPPGKDGWRIGLETLGSELNGTVLVENSAVSTSGDVRQYVEIDGVRYSHIVDPETGLGLTERIGVTVIAPNATTTDSYATAVSILGAEKGIAFIESKQGVECIVLRSDEAGEVTEEESSGMSEYWAGADEN